MEEKQVGLNKNRSSEQLLLIGTFSRSSELDLRNFSQEELINDRVDCVDVNSEKKWHVWLLEWKGLLQLGGPVAITYLLEMAPDIVCIMFIGHMQNINANAQTTGNYLAAATLATMYLNVTGMAPGFGIATAIGTLCSQAYGANEKKLLGIILQRGIVILLTLCIPIGFIWLFADSILLALGQDPKISHLAGQYCRISLIGLPPIFIYEALNAYLQAQSIVKPTTVIAALANVINIGANILFIFGFGWGFLGAAMARVVCNLSLPVMTLIFLKHSSSFEDTWDGFSLRDALSKWNQFITLAIPGMLMTCLEWWAFEIINLAVGIFTNKEGTELATQTIIINICNFMFMMPLGIAAASTVRVGNFLGAGAPSKARRTSHLAIAMVAIFEIGSCAALIIFRHVIPKAFTTNTDEVDLASQVFPIMASFQIFDGVQGVCSGVLRGCGRQKTGALLNFAAYYVIGIPCAMILAFLAHLGIFGIWWGCS